MVISKKGWSQARLMIVKLTRTKQCSHYNGAMSMHSKGMTLLELLVVVALLSIVALAGISLIVDTGEWKQQQATEEQWLAAKRSIVGDNVVDAHYRREYSGFVADMGRLPECLRELIRPYDCESDLYGADDGDPNNDANRLTLFTQDIDSNQWYGWRGPYIGVPGTNEFRDGWRNQGRDDNNGNEDDVNYGWLFGTGEVNGTACENALVQQAIPGAIILQSCGDDGEVDNTETGFAGDFPYVESDGTIVPLVTRHDFQVDLGASWLNVPVKVKAATNGSSRIIEADSLRLRINYPVNGQMLDWSDAVLANAADRDAAPFLSATFPATDTRLVDGYGKVFTGDDGVGDDDLLTDTPATAATVTFVPSASVLSSTASDTLVRIPNAVSSGLTFDDGSALLLQDCPCDIVLEPALAVSGTITTSSTVVSAAIEPENIAPLTADLGKYVIEVPQGAEISGSSINMPQGSILSLSGTPVFDYFPKIMLDPLSPEVTSSANVDFFEGDLVELISGDQFLVASTSALSGTATVDVDLAVPTVPHGLRNITIVCESGPTGTLGGFLYDGNCEDSSFTPIGVPYQIEISPRSYVLVPNEIVWNIP